MFVRSGLCRTGKYRYIVACCSDAFLFAAAFKFLIFQTLFESPKISCTCNIIVRKSWLC